ncbi:MAG: hypothetical protein DRO23_09910 [Thermoprotei archaeon]|nr:MAG: hypothetical protein DRO23_09910 [Thermoprotei archaeon]
MPTVEKVRKILEEFLILLGIIGIILVLQPFSVTLYTLGWYLVFFATLAYIIFTIVPSEIHSAKSLAINYVKVLSIIIVIVLLFIVFSILIIPHIIY